MGNIFKRPDGNFTSEIEKKKNCLEHHHRAKSASPNGRVNVVNPLQRNQLFSIKNGSIERLNVDLYCCLFRHLAGIVARLALVRRNLCC
jgi:hypothetical protein